MAHTYCSLPVRLKTWTGLDVSREHPDWIGLRLEKMDPCPTLVVTRAVTGVWGRASNNGGGWEDGGKPPPPTFPFSA